MRHLKHNRSGTLLENSRIINPHRGVILPPLTTWVEKNPHLVTTKILVNKGKTSEMPGGPPTASVTAEIVTVGAGTSRCTDPLLRIAQLEQNIRFLQEQHQQMLAGLHQEIESLKQRNRDLQFQLVFSKGSIVSSSTSPSSPEEDSKTRILSPKQVNVTPLQVELLERELGELKVTLHEVNTRNAYLTAIVDEQKKKLERLEQPPPPSDPDLLSKLDDVESLVRKLRRENDDLRREMDLHQQQQQQQQSRGGGRHRGHYRGGHRFPPLHTQSYWQGGRATPGDKDDGGMSLPSLNMNAAHTQVQQHNGTGPPHGHYSGGKRSGNNNHHQYHQGGGGGGKYRGSQSRGHKS